MNQSRKTRVISKAFPGAAKALAGVANLIKIPAREVPEILGIKPGGFLVPAVGQALVMFAKEHFRERVESSAVASGNAAFRSRVMVKRLVNSNETLAGCDHSDVDIPVFPIPDLFVVHTN